MKPVFRNFFDVRRAALLWAAWTTSIDTGPTKMAATSTGNPSREAPFVLRLATTALGFAFFAHVMPQYLLKPYWGEIVAAFGGNASTGQGALGVVLWGSLSIHAIIYVLVNLFFLVLYRFELLNQFKIIPGPWPWQTKDPVKLAEFWSLVRRALFMVVVNNIIFGTLLAYLSFKQPRPGHSDYGDISLANFPSTWTMCWQLLVAILVEDAGFYWGHRAFHSHPLIYKYVHKHHHRWTTSLSIAAEDSSTIDWLFSAAIPFVLGPKICGGHSAMIACWMAYRISATLEGHSGYAFPFSFLRIGAALAGPGDAHDAHHSLNTGSYGSSLPFWDWLCGTEIPHERCIKYGKRRPTAEEAAAGMVCKLVRSSEKDDDSAAANGGFAAEGVSKKDEEPASSSTGGTRKRTPRT